MYKRARNNFPTGYSRRPGQDFARCLAATLEPLVEPLFHPISCGFRPKKNGHQAVEWVLDIWRDGYHYVLEVDILGFFDNIPHHVIMTGLSNVVAE